MFPEPLLSPWQPHSTSDKAAVDATEILHNFFIENNRRTPRRE
jgi:hypothetical protein